MVRINKSNFDRNKFQIVHQKTGNKSILNIDKFALDKVATYNILEKYNYEFPYKANLSAFNKHVHTLIKYIGKEFNEDVVEEEKVMGEIVVTRTPKWQKISSHTGRKSFISNNVLKGYREIDIRRATGHTDSRSFETYICLDD